jgi:hypothetical protein
MEFRRGDHGIVRIPGLDHLSREVEAPHSSPGHDESVGAGHD